MGAEEKEVATETTPSPQPRLDEIEKDSSSGSNPISSTVEDNRSQGLIPRAFHAAYRIISYTPQRCRWDLENPREFGMGLNLLFSFVGLSPLYGYFRQCPSKPVSSPVLQLRQLEASNVSEMEALKVVQ